MTLRFIKEFHCGNVGSAVGQYRARVYRDTEWDEFRVRFYCHAQHLEDADYHTDDKRDAMNTAVAELERMQVRTEATQ